VTAMPRPASDHEAIELRSDCGVARATKVGVMIASRAANTQSKVTATPPARETHCAPHRASGPTTEGSSANWSPSAVEPISATPNRKLKNGDQRPAPEPRARRTEILEIAGQRRGAPA
jgi:hypothetical protein